MKKIRKNLKLIHKNGLSSLKISLFQKTIITDLMTLINKKHEIFEEKFDGYVHITEPNDIDLKITIDSDKLLKD